MSASLVGSEMCIRDRHVAAPMSVSACSVTHWPQEVSGEEIERHVATSSPVSYTHLTLPTICSV
eukprot:7986664-Alexandrium_andersonii.AAC.1